MTEMLLMGTDYTIAGADFIHIKAMLMADLQYTRYTSKNNFLTGNSLFAFNVNRDSLHGIEGKQIRGELPSVVVPNTGRVGVEAPDDYLQRIPCPEK